MTVAKKILEVMKAVRHIEKDGVNTHFNYRYASSDAVLSTLREAMIENNLIMITEASPANDNTDTMIINYRFTFCDVDDGDTKTMDWVSTAIIRSANSKGEVKTDDKADLKTHTTAQKYFLLRLFMIPTGDDPDKDRDDTTPAPRQQASASVTNIMGESPDPITNGQKGKIGAMTSKLFGTQADEARHSIVKVITGGRTETSTELTKQEAMTMIECLAVEESGRVVFGEEEWAELRKEYVSKHSNGQTDNLWKLRKQQANNLFKELNQYADQAG